MILTKSQYNQYLSEVNDPELSAAWGIEAMCEEAQMKRKTVVELNTPENPPQIVPLKVVTYLTGKYQWNFDVDNLPNQMRRIKKITLI